MSEKRITDTRTDEEIVAEIQEGVDLEENQLELWRRVQNIAKKAIQLYCGPMCVENANYEDFMQQCFLGMMVAASKYREAGASFKTFVFTYFRLYILDYNGSSVSSIRVPYRPRKRAQKYFEFVRQYKEEHRGKEPDRNAVIEGMNLRVQDYIPLMNIVNGLKEISKDEYLTPEGFSLDDVLASDERFEEVVCSCVYLDELREALDDALQLVPERTRNLVKLVYRETYNIQDAANVYGISKFTARNNIRNGFDKILLNPRARKRLESFMYEGYEYDIDALYRRLDKKREYANELYARTHEKTETLKEE